MSNCKYFLRNVPVSASSSMIDISDEFDGMVKDLCITLLASLLIEAEDGNMLLANSEILGRFFLFPISESMDVSIELMLIASLFGRFLDLWVSDARITFRCFFYEKPNINKYRYCSVRRTKNNHSNELRRYGACNSNLTRILNEKEAYGFADIITLTFECRLRRLLDRARRRRA